MIRACPVINVLAPGSCFSLRARGRKNCGRSFPCFSKDRRAEMEQKPHACYVRYVCINVSVVLWYAHLIIKQDCVNTKSLYVYVQLDTPRRSVSIIYRSFN